MSMSSVPMLAFTLSTRQLIWSMLIFQRTCIIGLAYGVKQHLVPRKTVEGLKIKRHIPPQIGPSLQWGSVYLPSVAQSEAVGWILCLSAFSHSKLNKHLLRWSCEHLLSSAPLCRPARFLAGPAFVRLWQRDKPWVSVWWPHRRIFTLWWPSVHVHGWSRRNWIVSWHQLVCHCDERGLLGFVTT